MVSNVTCHFVPELHCLVSYFFYIDSETNEETDTNTAMHRRGKAVRRQKAVSATTHVGGFSGVGVIKVRGRHLNPWLHLKKEHRAQHVWDRRTRDQQKNDNATPWTTATTMTPRSQTYRNVHNTPPLILRQALLGHKIVHLTTFCTYNMMFWQLGWVRGGGDHPVC